MKKAKNVNFKTLNDLPPEPDPRWFRCSVLFKNRAECKYFSMPLAIKLHTHCPYVYFARYCNVTESRTDFVFALPERHTVNFAVSTLNHLNARQFKTLTPLPCEGSLAHARGFDAVLEIWNKNFGTADDNDEVEFDYDSAKRTAFNTLADVHHWQANMLGLDYTDEGQLNLYGLSRIMNIFAASVAKGNQLSDASKAVTKKKSKVERN